MDEAINAYRSVTASSEFQEFERLREKARYDEVAALSKAAEDAAKNERAKWQEVISEKDAELREVVTEKNTELRKAQEVVTEKDVEIQRLRNLLAQKGESTEI